jgi:purine-binding chemotaxis protein CheW
MSASHEMLRLVTFGVGDSLYAAEIAHVERVLRHESVHPLPGMPAWVDGVIDYQGRVVPVMDLRRRFGLDDGLRRGAGRLLVFTLGGDVVAAAVDRVIDVRSVTAGDIAPPPRLVRGTASEFLRGMVRQGDKMILVLDLLRLLSDDEQASLPECLVAPDVAEAAGRSPDA